MFDFNGKNRMKDCMSAPTLIDRRALPRRQLFAYRQTGFLSLPNDNIYKTIGVATLLCLVCSVIVALSAILLKPKQIENKLLDKKTNILAVAGLTDASQPVEERFSKIESIVVDLDSGAVQVGMDGNAYDQRKASRDPAQSAVLDKSQDIAVIKRRANLANVYLLREGEALQKIILPVKGYGLWSTMHGFIALESDAETVSGITFYEHGETPGLGGEIENKKWQQSWQGKQLIDENGDVALEVIKGPVSETTSDPQYKVDGLAGATLTSIGVSNLIEFWMGENGFGPYLATLRSGARPDSALSPEKSSSNLDQTRLPVRNAVRSANQPLTTAESVSVVSL